MIKRPVIFNLGFLIIAATLILFFSYPASLAQNIMPLSRFDRDDRLLIFAAHPDDEAIGAGGVIQEALKAGAKVKIVYFTSGDYNQLAFIVYEKRPILSRSEFVNLGEIRRKESAAAMKSLGLSGDDLVFLGYPDFGTMEIMTKYWGNTKPFASFLTGISKVPYPECLSPGAPYVGESVLRDMEKVILEYKPTKVFVSHPVDTNRDHRALYLFLRVALWDLKGKVREPEVFPYLIHVVDWPKPRGYHPDLRLEPPEQFKDSGILWKNLDLTDEEVKVKHDVISFYKSQIEYEPPYLFTFARKNELFGDYLPIKLRRQDDKSADISWQAAELPGENDTEKEEKFHIHGLAYARKKNDLFVKLISSKKLKGESGFSLFLLGYSRSRDFAVMPKIHISIGRGGLRLKDKNQTLFIKSVQLNYDNNSMIIKLPLSVLGDPSYILVGAKASGSELPFDETAWRILELE